MYWDMRQDLVQYILETKCWGIKRSSEEELIDSIQMAFRIDPFKVNVEWAHYYYYVFRPYRLNTARKFIGVSYLFEYLMCTRLNDINIEDIGNMISGVLSCHKSSFFASIQIKRVYGNLGPLESELVEAANSISRILSGTESNINRHELRKKLNVVMAELHAGYAGSMKNNYLVNKYVKEAKKHLSGEYFDTDRFDYLLIK